MRLVRYEGDDGVGLGVRVGDRDVAPTPWRSFDELFAEGDPFVAVAILDVDETKRITPRRLLAPVVNRPQVIGTGGNYADHAAEAKDTIQVREPVFMPFLWGAVIGPDDPIVIPNADTQTDYEVELAVVIGRTARGLTERNAMDHVFGYTVVNDVSAREVMVREKFQVMLSKSVDTFVPVGPHVVTKDEIADPYALKIATYLNGEIRQNASTGKMMVDIPTLLSRITRTITLHPGDVVTTGTPGGVGFFRNPQEFMRPGDTITASVEGVGDLTSAVVRGW